MRSEEKPEFTLPDLEITALVSPSGDAKHLVLLKGEGRQVLVSSKVAQLIGHLRQGHSLTQSARLLSEQWDAQVGADFLRLVIERQMVPNGLARLGSAPDRRATSSVARPSIYRRLLWGTFRRTLLDRRIVFKICAPLSALYDKSSVAFAVAMIIATRWLLLRSLDWRYYEQLVMQLTAAEYVAGLAILFALILIHEFGHASAQIRYGLNAGHIGIQLYHYIPTLYANVDASWRLNPARRLVVDAGGVYFQAIAGSVLYLVYLKTRFNPLLTALLSSDTLALIALNPFVKFDGYWMVTDLLGVSNLQATSKNAKARALRRIAGRSLAHNSATPPGTVRSTILVAYGLMRDLFWVSLVLVVVTRARALGPVAWRLATRLLVDAIKGFRTMDPALALASITRLALFLLLILTVGSMVVSLIYGVAAWFRQAIVKRKVARGLGENTHAPTVVLR